MMRGREKGHIEDRLQAFLDGELGAEQAALMMDERVKALEDI